MTGRAAAGLLMCAITIALPSAAPADAPSGPSIAMVVPWGSGGAMLARRGGDESSPEGPMSFAVDRIGRVFVLDQASGRVAIFRPDGSLDAQMALPATTFQDIDLAPDGRVVVLDRLVRGSLLVLGPGGETVGEHRIDGPGIPEGGAVTALMVRPDGVWLEVLHEQSVRVLGPDLGPCERVATPGRPAPGGAADGWLSAEIDEAGAVAVVSGRPGGERVRGTVRAGSAITRIAWLEADAAGRVTVTFEVGEWDRDGGRPSSRGAVLSRRLEPLESLASPLGAVEWEQLREFRVQPDGTLWQMAFRPDGVVFLKWGRP